MYISLSLGINKWQALPAPPPNIEIRKYEEGYNESPWPQQLATCGHSCFYYPWLLLPSHFEADLWSYTHK